MTLGAPFWRFWMATVLANVGDGIRLAAFPLLAASLTEEPWAVSAVFAAGSLPWLVTGLWAGALADRRGARLLLVVADASRSVVLALLVVGLLTDRVSIGWIAVAAFALGVAETIRDTAAQTAVPRLVPAALLERANSRMVAGEVVGNEFIGPLVGAALFTVGAALPFVTNSALAAFGVLLVLSLPIGAPAAISTGTSTEPRGLLAGVGWLVRHRLLRALAGAGALVALADSAWFAVLVLYAQVRLGLGDVGFGVLLAAGAVGGTVGAATADRLLRTGRHAHVLTWSMALATVSPAALLLAPTRPVALAVVIVTSAAFALFNVAALSLRHRLVPEAVLGRVIAAWRTAVLGAGALGAVAGGVLASARGLDAPFLLSSVLGIIAIALWASVVRGAPRFGVR